MDDWEKLPTTREKGIFPLELFVDMGVAMIMLAGCLSDPPQGVVFDHHQVGSHNTPSGRSAHQWFTSLAGVYSIQFHYITLDNTRLCYWLLESTPSVNMLPLTNHINEMFHLLCVWRSSLVPFEMIQWIHRAGIGWGWEIPLPADQDGIHPWIRSMSLSKWESERDLWTNGVMGAEPSSWFKQSSSYWLDS